MKFATLLTPSSVYMSKTPFSSPFKHIKITVERLFPKGTQVIGIKKVPFKLNLYCLLFGLICVGLSYQCLG